MTCAQFRERYSEYRDGLITAAREARRFDRHLARCPTCRRYDAAVRRGVLALHETDSIEPSAGFRRRPDARLARERRGEPGPPARAGPAGARAFAVGPGRPPLRGGRRPE